MKALVIDYGLCIEHSLALIGDEIDTVYYYIPWQDAFPRFLNAIIGRGYEKEGLVKIKELWDYVDKVDLVVVFDTFLGDMVKWLRDRGYRVFGVGQEEMLENDRRYARKLQKKLGLPTQETEFINGFDKLVEYLKRNKNKVVKLNTFRGSLETFIHYDFESSEPLLDHLNIELGQMKKYVEFVVEDLVGIIEPGHDSYVIDGEYPDIVLWGYEKKGSGYVAKIEKYENIPKAIKKITDAFKDVFKQYKARTFYSTEIRVDEKGEGYLIDNTIRVPMPCPSACEMVVYKNWDEIIINGAEGKLVNPVVDEKIKYVASVSLESEWLDNHWLAVEFPKEYRKFIKFRKHIKHEDKIYCVPGFSSVGAVVGYGETIDEAIDMCKKIADEVKGYMVEYNYTGLQTIKEDIEKGEKLGLKFY